MKKLILLIGAVAASWSWARETVVIVPAHPDDLISSVGFCLLAQEKFDIHVVDLTHGERGLGPEAFEDGSCKRIRTAEEQSVCEAVGAKLHWLDEVDGEAYACRETCERLAGILKTLRILRCPELLRPELQERVVEGHRAHPHVVMRRRILPRP